MNTQLIQEQIETKVLDVGLTANGIILFTKKDKMINEFLSLATGGISYHNFLSWVLNHIE